ncbi:hypothetical protein BH10PSE14_BH10PSE14_38500 [soil metagenome]
MARRALRYAALLALALAIFLAWVNPAVLLPSNVGWVLRGSDWGQSSIGLNAYLRMSNWPGSITPLLLAPNGTHLLLMDANPLAGLILAPFPRWLPTGLQVIGPWLLLCLMLHVGFAYALLRRHAPDFLSALLGTALLTLLPTLYNRVGHATLCAHWLLLWALWVFVDSRRARSFGHWAAVIVIAGLVHSYLLLMVGAIWASALLHQVVKASNSRERRDAALMVAGIGLLVGAIAMFNGVVGSGLVSTDSYGNFTLSLDALWNPANPTYTALLPSSPMPSDGSAAFEGFQYLGAGLLALIVTMLFLNLRRARADAEREMLSRLAWLAPALVVLALIAIGPVLRWGGIPFARFDRPSQLAAMFDLVRASGRLFWPAAYTIVLITIVGAYRLPRPAATAALGIALALQLVDIMPMFAAIRATTAEASDRTMYQRARDPRWDALIAKAGSIDFEPPEPFRDLNLMEEIGWRATSHCRPMRYFYASRIPAATQARIDADRRSFIAGQIDPTRLYIVYRPQDAPPALRDRLFAIDGVAVIAPTRAGTPLAGCRTTL